ncbi:amidase signature domain-containing protein [Annulohypoxylon truncatum]|uniref:amidase signature domain-containing protein n=1 Tax=Annulohypoxylon truncatum TaxID=327061 RepID=UPI00200841F5|nr:amidase signature domain-containing protein [Annulohypoxylon truncatum]KAI1205235.1 amidase signature domain-containing protein [Annulohypoxylon truncatum]
MLWEQPFIQIGERFLYANAKPDVDWSEARSDVQPVTVLAIDESGTSAKDLDDKAKSFLDEDDVFCPLFLQNVVFLSDKKQSLAEIIGQLRELWSTETFAVLDRNRVVAEGPYFLTSRGLHRAWRLYPDPLDCFSLSITAIDDSYVPFPCTVTGGLHPTIAVPSRLHHRPTEEKPLNGLRIAVKDIIDIKGIRTSGGNRAYHELYLPRDQTAPAVERLVGLGAIIVGKTRTGQFAVGQDPVDYLDYFSNFNPRGEGYQSQSGSSGGSAGAVASYDWLDAALGTDTTGSIRGPANVYGLFTMRPTHGVLPMKGILPQSPEILDCPGILCRDINLFQRIMNLWDPSLNLKEPFKFPKRILKPTRWCHWNTGYPSVNEHIEKFITDTKDFLQVNEDPIDFNNLFLAQNPDGTGENMDRYLLYALPHCMIYDNYHFYDSFREEYQKLNDGRSPFIEPGVQFEWDEAKKISKERRAEAGRRMLFFRKWFEDEVMKTAGDGGSESIIVLPTARGFGPRYRDTLPNKRDYDDYETRHDCISVYGGLPEIVLPVGEYKYFSRISQKEESLPMAMSIIGARGSDAMLIELAKRLLEYTGRPTSLTTGFQAFSVASVSSTTQNGTTNGIKTTSVAKNGHSME